MQAATISRIRGGQTAVARSMVCDNAAMAGRPRTPEGDKIRNAILVMLRRAEIDYSPTPTFVEIGEAVERAHQTVQAYLRSMLRDGLVTWKKRQPRTLALTEKGRAEADLLLSARAQ